MTVLVPIGDFSRMTHLSVKALRFYHDQWLLDPTRHRTKIWWPVFQTAWPPVTGGHRLGT